MTSNNKHVNNPPQTPDKSANKLPYITAYSPKRKATFTTTGPSRTKQSFKKECDINNIMGRFAITGVIEHLAQTAPQYGDIAGLDFQGAMDIVAEARERFAALPSELRDRFANDPGRLLSFLQDEKNAEEAVKLGLLSPPAPPPGTGVPSPAADPTAAPSAAPAAPPAEAGS